MGSAEAPLGKSWAIATCPGPGWKPCSMQIPCPAWLGSGRWGEAEELVSQPHRLHTQPSVEPVLRLVLARGAVRPAPVLRRMDMGVPVAALTWYGPGGWH